MNRIFLFLLISNMSFYSCAKAPEISFTKIERMIPMRDGTKLFTAIYFPDNISGKFPILIERTPYSCSPYGEDNIKYQLGPGKLFENEPYIFVYQDVRGRYMSEGKFEEMTPHIKNKK